MKLFDWQNQLNRDGHQVLISGLPVAMHCHHYNINLQKTLEDTLAEGGVSILYEAVEETNLFIFRQLFEQYEKIKTLKSKLEMAEMMFQNCGLGIIHFQKVTREAADIVSPSSHHVTGWLAKHGRRSTPGCHFTRGWIAGLLAAIYDRGAGEYQVVETQCKMMRVDECRFQVKER